MRGINNPPPEKKKIEKIYVERVIETVAPFSFSVWWNDIKEHIKRRRFRKLLAKGKVFRGRTESPDKPSSGYGGKRVGLNSKLSMQVKRGAKK